MISPNSKKVRRQQMVFNSKTGRVAFEPGDTIRCRNADDAGQLADMLSDRQINWEFIYSHNGKEGIWITIQADEEAKQ